MGVISYTPISLTASVTLKRNVHKGPKLVLNASGGLTVTLPASTGKGDKYEFVVGTNLTTSNYVIQVANGSDIIAGAVMVATDIAGVTCPTTATSDTITMNGGTTGGVKGTYVVLEDVAANTWLVTGSLVSTSTEATPFSAAVA